MFLNKFSFAPLCTCLTLSLSGIVLFAGAAFFYCTYERALAKKEAWSAIACELKPHFHELPKKEALYKELLHYSLTVPPGISEESALFSYVSTQQSGAPRTLPLLKKEGRIFLKEAVAVDRGDLSRLLSLLDAFPPQDLLSFSLRREGEQTYINFSLYE